MQTLVPAILRHKTVITALVTGRQLKRPAESDRDRRSEVPIGPVVGNSGHLLGAARAPHLISNAPQFAIQAQETIVPAVAVGGEEAGFESGVVVELLPMTQQPRIDRKTPVVMQDSPQRRFTRDASVGIAPIAAIRTNRQKSSRVEGKLDRARHACTGNAAIDGARGDPQEFAPRGEIEGPTIDR